MDFYVYRDNQLEGPFTSRQLHDMMVADEIDPELLCAPDGAQEWKSISEVLSPVLSEKREAVAPEILPIARPALCAQALGFLSLLCIGMVVLHRQTGFYALAAMAVPAVITSSMIRISPESGAPTILPPSPWVLASLRLKA